ncbi:FMN-binding protein MioC [Psychromonas ossibalaenae]|uniref:FMN-binding protein MioC n=1 Tax=Psychromonas ossibalaenae TaxID=444922 RepID=UPI0003719F3B|nr:FMN-binding protein MioC [Psychromonas ossibalaenae]
MSNIQILVGSTLGGAEYVAEAIQPLLEEAGFDSELHFDPDLNSLSLQQDQIWLICISTHGAGDYPENFKPFVEQLQQVNAPLNDVRYGVVGIGDSNYDTYCEASKNIDFLLEDMGAVRLGERFDIDVAEHPIPEDHVLEWIPMWIEDLNDIIED